MATMALCEAAAYYKTKNMTLWDAMLALYERVGYYKDGVQSVTMKGIEGLAKIQEIMTTLRENPPKEFCGHKVTSFRDYQKDIITDIATGETKPTGLPKSNVLYYRHDRRCMDVRTPIRYRAEGEVLLRCCRAPLFEDADAKSEAMAKAVSEMVAAM